MATKTKNPSIRIVTPAGSALFVSCPNASKFDSDKQEASIILTQEEGDAIVAQMDAMLEEHGKAMGLNAKNVKYPMKPHTDRDGNETGNVVLKSKTGMKFPAKLLDAKGTEFTPDTSFTIPNGSTVRFSLSVVLMKTAMFSGFTARLNGIKIIDMPQRDLGFGEDDGGFSYSESTVESSDVDSTEDDWA